MSQADFLRPGRLAQVGLDAGRPLLQSAGELMGFVSFFENFVQISVLMLAWLIILIAFFILAVQLFVTLIEFKLTTLAGFVLIPFALFNKTAFLAEKVLGNVVASGVKILVLAVIVGIGSGLFGEFTAGFGADQPTIEETLSIVLAALALFGLGIFGPGIATGLVSGAPQLGAGAAVGTSLAIGGLGAAAAVGTGAGVRAGASLIAGTARGGAVLAGGATTAYGLASAASGDTGWRASAAGIGGIIRAGGAAALQPARTTASRVATSLKQSYEAGSRALFAATVAGHSSETPDTSRASSSSSDAPAWAKHLRRSQTLAHGVSAAAHAVRSGDHGGGSTSLSLEQDPRS